MKFETLNDFRELSRIRRTLQHYCSRHVRSLLHFAVNWEEDHNEKTPLLGFREFSGEEENSDPRHPYHLTTTATCIQSLVECPEEFWPEDMLKLENSKFSPTTLAQKLSKHMLDREKEPHKNWTSYSSAGLFSRCRSLPIIINKAEAEEENLSVLSEHLYRIFLQMHCDPERMGIGEETVEVQEARKKAEGVEERVSLEEIWEETIKKWIEEKDKRAALGFSDFMKIEREHVLDKIEGNFRKNEGERKRTIWLPINAFHTYWAMATLREYRTLYDAVKKKRAQQIVDKCKNEGEDKSISLDMDCLKAAIENESDVVKKEIESVVFSLVNEKNWPEKLENAIQDIIRDRAEEQLYKEFDKRIQRWTKTELARQIYLHHDESPHLDSDQLGWLLAIYVRFCEGIWYRADDRGLIQSGLKCLFQTQLPPGVWKTYRPIFHYKHAGDAYCYMFETLGELLRGCWQYEAQGKRI